MFLPKTFTSGKLKRTQTIPIYPMYDLTMFVQENNCHANMLI